MSSISDETYHLGEFEPRPDDDVVICRCEEITRGEIRRAVHAGMYTMNEVKRFLRAGMGLCQGQSCNKTVRAIIGTGTGHFSHRNGCDHCPVACASGPHGCLWKRYILSKISGRWQR